MSGHMLTSSLVIAFSNNRLLDLVFPLVATGYCGRYAENLNELIAAWPWHSLKSRHHHAALERKRESRNGTSEPRPSRLGLRLPPERVQHRLGKAVGQLAALADETPRGLEGQRAVKRRAHRPIRSVV